MTGPAEQTIRLLFKGAHILVAKHDGRGEMESLGPRAFSGRTNTLANVFELALFGVETSAEIGDIQLVLAGFRLIQCLFDLRYHVDLVDVPVASIEVFNLDAAQLGHQ
ncbi:MAG: hypothetical protein CMH16_14365 [Methylobacterium sp.]|nr:hypothetical protein [Methylobacterium sp.]